MAHRARNIPAAKLARAIPAVDAWLAKERERRAAIPSLAIRRHVAATILAGMASQRGSADRLVGRAVELADALLRRLQ